MAKTAEIPIENRVKVVVLFEEGYTLRKICERTGVSYGGVHAIIEKFKKNRRLQKRSSVRQTKIDNHSGRQKNCDYQQARPI